MMIDTLAQIRRDQASIIKGPLYELELQRELDRCGTILFWKTRANNACTKPMIYHCRLYLHCKKCRKFRTKELYKLLQGIFACHSGVCIAIVGGAIAHEIVLLSRKIAKLTGDIGKMRYRRIPITATLCLMIYLPTGSPFLDNGKLFICPTKQEIAEWVSVIAPGDSRESGHLGEYIDRHRSKGVGDFDFEILVPDVIASEIPAAIMRDIVNDARDTIGWPDHDGTPEEIAESYRVFFQYVELQLLQRTTYAELKYVKQGITRDYR